MKFLIPILAFICLYSCGRNDKRTPSTIYKDADFLHVTLEVYPKNKETILADLRISNTSKNSVLLYKPLFPFNGKMAFPCFSIFNAESFEQVSFSKPIGKFKTYDPYDEGEEIIIPESTPEKYFTLHGGETVAFQVNLSDWYHFKSSYSGQTFKVVPSISNPLVSGDYKQQYEKDSVDGQMKPVFCHIMLPKKSDVDSMRVKFVLP
ncbi:hypothetical protein [Lacibacter sp.]|uniref:hypothetical protein n=1 Tax=Lacibacter sp. TaxID=1915409 RepID=UPI002B4B0C96|nr:hypothetical protein [Lacibacter sp.]HLP35641.1 hypothetical protein [Lacibacter sp.]